MTLAFWLVPVMVTLAPADIPRIADATIDGRVLAVAVALSVLTGCTFGLAPGLRLSRRVRIMSRRLMQPLDDRN